MSEEAEIPLLQDLIKKGSELEEDAQDSINPVKHEGCNLEIEVMADARDDETIDPQADFLFAHVHEHIDEYDQPSPEPTTEDVAESRLEADSEEISGEILEVESEPEIPADITSQLEPEPPSGFYSAPVSVLENLDEISSNLDTETEEDIQRILNRHMQQAYREIIQLLKDRGWVFAQYYSLS